MDLKDSLVFSNFPTTLLVVIVIMLVITGAETEGVLLICWMS